MNLLVQSGLLKICKSLRNYMKVIMNEQYLFLKTCLKRLNNQQSVGPPPVLYPDINKENKC
ncbi:hypothetical protein LCGC14_1136570 [marine sediment metagenome]|uniref:Uncharacterized protein n=1 Tax=marine sediment metagenome TaxID=412755 RepID=A0A0F9LZN3_9ZZZZ